jgi:predicted DNA-binding protein YlxM (UPF0122 family)
MRIIDSILVQVCLIRRTSPDCRAGLLDRLITSSSFKGQSEPVRVHWGRSSGVSLLATLKQFEEALRAQGMNMALAILEKMRKEEKKTRSIAPARRVSGRKMTPELARKILELHSTTDMTQQEIAFQLGINQGRVNEVIKRGKWLTDDPQSEEAQARDKAKARMKRMQSKDSPISRKQPVATHVEEGPKRSKAKPANSAQLSIDDFLKASSD